MRHITRHLHRRNVSKEGTKSDSPFIAKDAKHENSKAMKDKAASYQVLPILLTFTIMAATMNSNIANLQTLTLHDQEPSTWPTHSFSACRGLTMVVEPRTLKTTKSALHQVLGIMEGDELEALPQMSDLDYTPTLHFAAEDHASFRYFQAVEFAAEQLIWDLAETRALLKEDLEQAYSVYQDFDHHTWDFQSEEEKKLGMREIRILNVLGQLLFSEKLYASQDDQETDNVGSIDDILDEEETGLFSAALKLDPRCVHGSLDLLEKIGSLKDSLKKLRSDLTIWEKQYMDKSQANKLDLVEVSLVKTLPGWLGLTEQLYDANPDYVLAHAFKAKGDLQATTECIDSAKSSFHGPNASKKFEQGSGERFNNQEKCYTASNRYAESAGDTINIPWKKFILDSAAASSPDCDLDMEDAK